MADLNGIRSRQGNIVQLPGEPVIHQFAFSHSTPSLNTGVTIYSPTPGDILLDAWIEVDTAFNGTTPLADVGDFTSDNRGWFGDGAGAVNLTHADSSATSGPLLLSNGTGATPTNDLRQSGITEVDTRLLPGKLTLPSAVKLVVSQDGLKGGTATGATAGSGVVYLYVGTPV